MKKKGSVYIETYGCQMNFSDSEIVASVLLQEGYEISTGYEMADFILLNTCSIRENAEDRIRKRLRFFRSLKKKNPGLLIGLLGCMADRTKAALMGEEELLDLIAGPDSYRHLPQLLKQSANGGRAVDTLLSADETYDDITPVHLDSNGVTAFISIMRGCENYCTYCVVPSTRGKERSRDSDSIVKEAANLFDNGFQEVTLLGQNVNSYQWKSPVEMIRFAGLLEKVARINPLLRVRFATSHPKDLSDELLHTIERHENICRSVHLPVQSGSNSILDRMNRKYTREQYLERIESVRRIIPGCAVSTDIITGFCGESDDDHRLTLSLMEAANFDSAFMFKYSQRPRTLAAEILTDDIPEEIKTNRLREIIDLQQKISLTRNRQDNGKIFSVLAEGPSKRSPDFFFGRNSQNKVVVFPKQNIRPGDLVNVRIHHVTSATLLGDIV